MRNTLTQTFSGWSKHEAPRLGAALAFYTILSLAPLVILAVAVIAFVFNRSTAQDRLLTQAGTVIGQQGVAILKEMLKHAQLPSSGIVASAIGFLSLLFGTSGVVGELRAALNTMWDVKPQEDGIWGAVKQRFLFFGIVIAAGFLLLVSLLIGAGLATAGKFFSSVLPLPGFVLSAIYLVISFAGIAVLFALILRYVPAATVQWRNVWKGAALTSFLFTVGKFLIGVYLSVAAVGSAYGAAGSLVVVIVWIYYSAMIFLFGAEFTHVLETRPVKRTFRYNGVQPLPLADLPRD